MLIYISNSAHYKEVLSHVMHVKHSLWIGTADIKDLYIEEKGKTMPFLGVLAKLIKKGVAVRLIHAKEQDQYSGRILTDIPFCMMDWRGCFVQGYISR